INGEKAEIDLKQRGYLFLAQDKNRYELEQQAKLQQAYDVPSEFLSPDDLLNVIPELHTDDLVGGLYCAEDGYLDPYSVMTGYAKKAKQLGTEYIYEPVDHLLTDKKEITGVELENGEVYSAPIVINSAGPWVPALSDTIDCPVPVIPLKRQIIQFDIAEPLQKNLPLTVDPTEVYFRHEGNSLIVGYSEKVKPGINFRWSRDLFTEQLWPVLAHRVKNFERAKIISGWAGMYSHNTEDQNAI